MSLEVAPVSLRPYLTTCVNLCRVFDQLLGSEVLGNILSYTSERGYRIALLPFNGCGRCYFSLVLY
jgi:hypothetical protein